jgi:hypothetical protein
VESLPLSRVRKHRRLALDSIRQAWNYACSVRGRKKAFRIGIELYDCDHSYPSDAKSPGGENGKRGMRLHKGTFITPMCR